MQYEIIGTTLPVLEFTLQRGETVFTELGGMSWMSDGIKMQTTGRGGIGGFISRALSGESLFITTFNAERDGVRIAFTPEVPGTIIDMHLGDGQEIIAQQDAFMVAEDSIDLSVAFRRRLGAGIFGGEGFVMQRVKGPGHAFFEIGGELRKITLAKGEELKVNPGHVAMHEASVDYDIYMVRGIRNLLFGGEGLFLANLRGPGDVWLQTLPFANLVSAIYARLPKPEPPTSDE